MCLQTYDSMEAVPWYADILTKLSITELREHQRQFVGVIESANDCLVLLPTGYGKSLFYQLVPHHSHGKSQSHNIIEQSVIIVALCVSNPRVACDHRNKDPRKIMCSDSEKVIDHYL